MLPHRTPTQDKKAFTLLELIVAIVVLAVLAAIAVPTFNRVIEKSKDEAAETSLAAVAREAAALAAFENRDVTQADLETAAADLNATGSGTYAAQGWSFTTSSHSNSYGNVSLRAGSDGTGLAMESETGNCAFVLVQGSNVKSWQINKDLGTNCHGAIALEGPKVTSEISKSDGATTPNGFEAVAGDTAATLSWNAVPGATSYTVHQDGAAPRTVTGTSTSTTITGLTNGTAYTFSITAKDAVSESTPSEKKTVTPRGIPAAPSSVTASAGDARATVSFTPGASNGSTITSYRVYSGSTQVGSGSATPITVTGLTNGTRYTFTVTAVNAAGESTKSAASNAVTPTAPGTLLTYSAFGDNKGVFHHLGTNQGTTTWSNPIGSGTVRSAVSGRLDSTKYGPNMTVDRDYTTTQSELITSNVANSWITYDLGAGKSLVPTKYTIRGRVSDSNYSLRNWKLQGSNDGTTWTDLKVHANDTTLTGAAAWGGWDLTGNTGYRHFRIIQTGLNSSNDHHLIYSEIELYGTLQG